MPILLAEPDIFPDHLLSAPVSQASWWVLHTLSRQEKRLCRALLQREVPFYCPTIAHHYRSPNGRSRTSYLPLFSSYVFLCGDEEQRYHAISTGCVSRCLKVSKPEQLLDDLLQIQRLVDLGVPLHPDEQLQPGMRVRVKSGPMQGLEGRILKRHDQARLFVAVNFIQCGASLELGDWELERLE